jgi:O-antigen/teichoic acid export membrane protein
VSAPASVGIVELAPATLTGAGLRDRVVRWGLRGSWAILDQATFALSNLLVNIVLARTVLPVEYGAFVTAYTLLLLVGVVHGALLIEPMMIFGAGRYRTSFSDYFATLERWHWLAAPVIGAPLLLVAVVLQHGGSRVEAGAFVGTALAGPCILFSWLARRACYAALMPERAAGAGALNFALVMSGLGLLAWLDRISVLAVLLLLATAAVLASVTIVVAVRRLTSIPLDTAARRGVLSEHVRYGRWVCATSLLNWGSGYIYYLVLPFWGGLAASASLRAASNLVMPLLQSDGALISVLTPVFVRNRGTRRFTRVVQWTAAAFSIEGLVYGAVLIAFGDRIVWWVYGNVYGFPREAFVALAFIPLLNSNSNVLATALRAREEPNAVFWAATASAVIVATGGLFAVALLGAPGALMATAAATGVQALLLLWLLRRSTPRKEPR